MTLNHLLKITYPLPLASLDDEVLAELQKALLALGYPLGSADGMIGPKTRNAWAEFKADVFQGNPELIGPGAIKALQQELAKAAEVQKGFATKEGTIALIRAECAKQGLDMPEQIAYVLATVEWESAKTFKPVREGLNRSDEWRKRKLRYYPYYGRGYVQITWKNNYEHYGKVLGIDLVNNPDLALDPKNALFILVDGFKTGAFTGRKLTNYIRPGHVDYVSARRCINGTDRAHEIAAMAKKYL